MDEPIIEVDGLVKLFKGEVRPLGGDPTLMLAVGFGIGFRPQTGVSGLLGVVAVGLAFGWAWSWVMALLDLLVRSAEAIQAAVFMVVFRWRSPARCSCPPRRCPPGCSRLPPTSPSPWPPTRCAG